MILKLIPLCAIVALLIASCKSSDSGPSSPPSGGGLTATPSSVHLMPSQNALVSLSGGTRPESITSSPNSSVATASLIDTVLTIHAVGVGSTSVTIGDHSSPQKTASVAITIATAAASMIFR